MKLKLYFLLCYLLPFVNTFGQSADTIKIKLVAGSEILPGATVIVRDIIPPTGTTTNADGLATLVIPQDKDFVEISFIGPYVRLKIERPVDSIYFDVNSKKATFYHKRNKIKTRKQVVKGY